MMAVLRANVGMIALGILAMLALGAMSLALVWRAQDQRRIDDLAHSTNEALCAFRAHLERQETVTTMFLADHPSGIPGITRADLLRSLESQRATLHALASLNC